MSKQRVLELILLVIYTTLIFYTTSSLILCLFIIINGFCTLKSLAVLRRGFRQFVRMLPFIFLVAVANLILGTLESAILITIRLSLVCWITILYAQRVGFLGLIKTLQSLFRPLARLGLQVDDLVLMLILTGALSRIFRRNLRETQAALRAKGSALNLKSAKILLTYLFIKSFRQVNELDSALRAKGFQ